MYVTSFANTDAMWNPHPEGIWELHGYELKVVDATEVHIAKKHKHYTMEVVDRDQGRERREKRADCELWPSERQLEGWQRAIMSVTIAVAALDLILLLYAIEDTRTLMSRPRTRVRSA
ncbi:hypothetical protein SARC_13514 [Sphaeroforma arctica JP610]|uniref:Uncharacterized protein n=1 Tax=Sphaeroforma arctica JP610 TaxID=667725 RepID=A0A0L0FB39_9EUKA|nr:hypothetical protein SARC_13514 [Sphaeroforma arctica JP610]KNC73927.1 hypothetical protein SARC_13514 [Sphaeroforma arctica JP610]|eukprot:XP_014147829.1 hypothetical protein SARC_13514 [Sphaeroforma arctica JP610]